MTIEDSELSLRATTYHDTAFAWRLYRDLMKPVHEELIDWDEKIQRKFVLRDLISGEASIILIKGEMAGWIQVRRTARQMVLTKLYLASKFQNMRIGTMIIRKLIFQAQQSGRELFLDVTRNNRARELYERLGFIIIGEDGYMLRMVFREVEPPAGRTAAPERRYGRDEGMGFGR